MPYSQILSIIDRARDMGFKRLSTGVQLIGHIPHLAPEAYLHVVFPALDESQLEEIERQVERPLPEPFRRLLEMSNGMLLFAYSLAIYGLRGLNVRTGDEAWQPFSIRTSNTMERPRNIPWSALIVGSYRQDGSYVYIDGDTGVTIRCTRQSGTNLNQWDNFETFLLSEVTRLSTAFDSYGKLRSSAQTTP